MATHVELFEEGLRTGVQIPPAPPYPLTKAANDIQLVAFFFGKSNTCVPTPNCAVKVPLIDHLQIDNIKKMKAFGTHNFPP